MKVHVISDMEGVAGISRWQQVVGGDDMYDEGRRLYTEEINAAVRGAKAAGATEIVVSTRRATTSCSRSGPSTPSSSSPAATRRSSSRCTRGPARRGGVTCEIVVDFQAAGSVDKYRDRAGVEIVDPRRIVSRADDWWTAWRQFFFA